MAVGQVALVTAICATANVWKTSIQARQFPGHLGPSIFIAAIGVGALCNDWHWKRRCEFEGRLSVTAAVVYVTGETLEALVSKGGRLASFYVKHGLHAWMALVIGVCGGMLLAVPRLEPQTGVRLKDVPHLWFAVAWAWFIYNHKQPNDYGVNMHWCATAWILIGGGLRCLKPDNAKEAGAAYVLAAYTFFGGQLGLTLKAAKWKANPGSYVLFWHALPMAAVLAYVRVFNSSTSSPRSLDDEEECLVAVPDSSKRRG